MIGLVMQLRDPEACPHPLCPGDTRVISKRTRRLLGFIWRRHACLTCGRRWTSYQSLAHPKLIDPADVDPDLRQRKL